MLTLFEKPLSGQGCTILQYLCDLDVSLIHQAMLSIRECNLQPCEFNVMLKQVQNVKAPRCEAMSDTLIRLNQDNFALSSVLGSHVILLRYDKTACNSAVWADICLNFWEEWRRNELTGRGGACVNSSIQVLWNWVHNTLQCVNSSIHVLRNWVHNTCKDGPLWVPWGNFYRTQVSLVRSLCPDVRPSVCP